jgi:hypothetical protein
MVFFVRCVSFVLYAFSSSKQSWSFLSLISLKFKLQIKFKVFVFSFFKAQAPKLVNCSFNLCLGCVCLFVGSLCGLGHVLLLVLFLNLTKPTFFFLYGGICMVVTIMVMVVVIFWYIGLWCFLWPWSHFSISVFHWFGCVLLLMSLMSLWTWYILLLVFWSHWSCSFASTFHEFGWVILFMLFVALVVFFY